jgi:hypothetical protein
MELVSLVSLVIDFEIPPREIIDAINSGRLHPVVPPDEVVSLESISFPSDEVSNVFWAYQLKSKSAETKAELTRRFQRHVAIVSSIIGAVVGSGTVALVEKLTSKKEGAPSKPAPARASPRLWSDHKAATSAPRFFQQFPQDFIVPVEPEPGYEFSFRNTEVLIGRPTGEYINVRAVADGLSVTNLIRAQEPPRSILLQHDRGWFTLYEARGNTRIDVMPVGLSFGQGDRIAHCHPVQNVRPEISFSMWRSDSGGDLVPVFTGNLDWANVPRPPQSG